MIDYTIRVTSGAVIKGNDTKSESFAELWKFVRGPNNWVLDRIDQHVLKDLLQFHSATEQTPYGSTDIPAAVLRLPGRE